MKVMQRPQQAVYEEEHIVADQASYGGRILTLIMFTIVFSLLGMFFFWLGGSHINNYFVSQADKAYSEQDYLQAIPLYTWAVRFDSSDAHSFINRGYCLQQLGRDAEALPNFTRYIFLQPKDAAGFSARGESQVRLNQLNEAITDFSAAIERDADDTASYARLSLIHI